MERLSGDFLSNHGLFKLDARAAVSTIESDWNAQASRPPCLSLKYTLLTEMTVPSERRAQNPGALILGILGGWSQLLLEGVIQ